MRVPIVSVGNSRGIRIPATVLRACAGDAFELSIERGRIILDPLPATRAGWEAAFANDSVAASEYTPEIFAEDAEGWEW